MKMMRSAIESNTKNNLTDETFNKNLDWAIGWNRAILKSQGLWTYAEQSRFRVIFSHAQATIIGLCMFFFVTLPQTTALIKIFRIPDLLIDNIAINLPALVAEFKLLTLWYKKKELAGIFSLITNDWLKTTSSSERNVMIKYAKIARIFTIGGVTVTATTNVLYYTPITYNSVLRTLNNITDNPDALFALQAVYFHDVTSPIAYRLTLISQIIGTICTGALYTGTDVLFSMIVFHLCGQVENLSSRVAAMADERKNFHEYLKNNIDRHCELIRFTNETENIFSLLILALIVLFSVIFCVEAFHLIDVFTNSDDIPVNQVAFYATFVGHFLFLMFIYSWVGETLVTQSELLYEACYNCDWTYLTSKESFGITILLIRMKKVLHITAGKFAPMTLNTFVSVIRTSCGWISVLLAMKT